MSEYQDTNHNQFKNLRIEGEHILVTGRSGRNLIYGHIFDGIMPQSVMDRFANTLLSHNNYMSMEAKRVIYGQDWYDREMELQAEEERVRQLEEEDEEGEEEEDE